MQFWQGFSCPRLEKRTQASEITSEFSVVHLRDETRLQQQWLLNWSLQNWFKTWYSSSIFKFWKTNLIGLTNVNPTQAGSAWQVSWHFSGLSKSTNTLQEKTRSVFQLQVPPVYVVLVPGGVTFEAGGNRQVPRAEWKRQGREGDNQAELQK